MTSTVESPTVADADDFPILGEPLTVELANTRYTHSTGVIDFLGSVNLVASWFAKAPGAAALSLPARLSVADIDAIRQIRDAAHGALGALVGAGASADPRHVAILDHHASAAPSYWHLESPDVSGATARLVYRGRKPDAFRAQLAGEVIVILGGPQLSRVRRVRASGLRDVLRPAPPEAPLLPRTLRPPRPPGPLLPCHEGRIARRGCRRRRPPTMIVAPRWRRSVW